MLTADDTEAAVDTLAVTTVGMGESAGAAVLLTGSGNPRGVGVLRLRASWVFESVRVIVWLTD